MHGEFQSDSSLERRRLVPAGIRRLNLVPSGEPSMIPFNTLLRLGLGGAFFLACCGCGNDALLDQTNDGQEPDILFQSGFEEPNLFPADGSAWSVLVLQTPPGMVSAAFKVQGDRIRTGARAAWFMAPPGGEGKDCGKSSVIRRQTVEMGETLTFSGYYWLDESAISASPQLMDVECDPGDCGYMSSPGVRVVTTRDRRLRLDWKFLNWFKNNGLPLPDDAPPISPIGITELPAQTWFRLTLRLVLGKGRAGLTEIYLDDHLEISVAGTNIAPDGMEQLIRYSGVEVGITCNPTSSMQPVSLYLDDVVITRES